MLISKELSAATIGAQLEDQSVHDDWSYAHLRPAQTLWGPHGYHRYPAKFIPQLVRRLIEEYSSSGDVVGDPFLGSATTGVEALRAGRKFWGADINPIALLISHAKCTPIEPLYLANIWRGIETKLAEVPIVGRRTLTEEEKKVILGIDIARASHDERVSYWFPKPYYHSLQYLLEQILEISELPIRTFFLCAFSNILRSSSIWLSGSTKPQKDLTKILSDPKAAFIKQCRDMKRRNQLYWDDISYTGFSPNKFQENCLIDLADAKQLPLRSGMLDLLVTSPPYATCYEYTELHQLTELWLTEYNLLSIDRWKRSCIGSRSTCQSYHQGTNTGTSNSQIADKVLDSLDLRATKEKNNGIARDSRALRRYFQDMSVVLKELSRVVGLDKHLILIVGNSYKRGLYIPTSDAIVEMAVVNNLVLENKITRNVAGRVLVSTRDSKTGRFSSTEKSDSKVYAEEDILVFRRIP